MWRSTLRQCAVNDLFYLYSQPGCQPTLFVRVAPTSCYPLGGWSPIRWVSDVEVGRQLTAHGSFGCCQFPRDGLARDFLTPRIASLLRSRAVTAVSLPPSKIIRADHEP